MVILGYLAFGYLSMALIKFTMALTSLPTAIGVLSRLDTGQRGWIVLRHCFVLPALALAMALIFWPSALRKERLRFFMVYPTRQVIRDIAYAWKHSHA